MINARTMCSTLKPSTKSLVSHFTLTGFESVQVVSAEAEFSRGDSDGQLLVGVLGHALLHAGHPATLRGGVTVGENPARVPEQGAARWKGREMR